MLLLILKVYGKGDYMAEKNKKLTPFQQEQISAAHKVVDFKKNCEANIAAILYKVPEEFYNISLTVDEFSNNIWKVYFQIAYDIIKIEGKKNLDDITIGMYLEKHPKLNEKYNEYGGYRTIKDAGAYIQVENLEGYINELRKWNAVIKLCQRGYPVNERISDFVDMTAESIYNEYSAFLNDTFSNIDMNVRSYDICDGIHELIEKLDEGLALGLPYHNMPMLTKEVGGQCLGTITLLGGISNAGKSTVCRSLTIPSILELDERIVIMINEDSFAKWQREMLVWVLNNVLHYDIQKYVVRDGRYSVEVKSMLHKAADWLEDKSQNHKITIIPFQQYQTSKAIKSIRKYAAMGVKYFMLDTFKMDAGQTGKGNVWVDMQQAMVDIKDTVKEAALNVHILITFQLEKGSSVMRYYTQNNIGMAKNIVDVASTCIMIRDIFDDEYADENRALNVYRLEGKNNATKIAVKLDKSKKYQIFFIVKNQEGAANDYQIVAEHDKSRNIIKEIGITNLSPDF